MYIMSKSTHRRDGTLDRRYSDHGPIALNSWAEGAHSYVNLFHTIDKRVEHIPAKCKRELARCALLSRTTDHSMRNWDTLSDSGIDLDKLSMAEQEVVMGDAPTHRFIQFLNEHPSLGSIEIARLIHPGDWDVREYIDTPVRSDLDDTAHRLDTVELPYKREDAHYKLKQFDMGKSSHPDSVIVERKRQIRTHLGGRAVTVVRNTILVDGNHLSKKLRKHIREERGKVRHGSYDYDAHSEELNHLLEDHIVNRELDGKPRELIPLMSTYYTWQHRRNDGN